MNLDEKNKIWEEINDLVHIGRSADDIKNTLFAMGYNQSILKDILTTSFMDRLIQKEQSFVGAQRAEREENEALKQKSQEQQAQKQKMEWELLKQDKEQNKIVKDEKKRTNFEEQKVRGIY